jgi:hypothetical protein
MDFTVTWKVSSDVEKLVAAVNECKQGLTTSTFSKYGRAKLLFCDVYASAKLLELFQLSALWTPCLEFSESDLRVRPSHRPDPVSTLVADFELFKLHRDRILSDDVVRLVAVFDVTDGVDKTMYGNVQLVY